jgi:hypothetical protein
LWERVAAGGRPAGGLVRHKQSGGGNKPLTRMSSKLMSVVPSPATGEGAFIGLAAKINSLSKAE